MKLKNLGLERYMINTHRKYWDVGDDFDKVFRLSKDRSQLFLKALLLCDGKIHDMYSLDVSNGEIKYNMKVHQIAVLYRISLPENMESKFNEIMGEKYLSEPPIITGA